MNQQVVIIPTYNEAENIVAIIRAVMELPVGFDLLVVDDNSLTGLPNWSNPSCRIIRTG